MNYRIFYYEEAFDKLGNPIRLMKNKIIKSLEETYNYNIYYMTDMNGNIIIDERGINETFY